MEGVKTQRGFTVVEHEKYADEARTQTRLVQESSAVGDYNDALDNPGSSFLWVGQDHRLNREEVEDLIDRMAEWLVMGRLAAR